MKSLKTILFSILCLLFVNISTAQTNTPAKDTEKTVNLKVKGVTCSGDLKTIAGNVEKLKGVKSCKAEKPGATTRFLVVYNPALVTEKEIHAAIEGTEGCENPEDRPYKVKIK